jgi:hypothetical protein
MISMKVQCSVMHNLHNPDQGRIGGLSVFIWFIGTMAREIEAEKGHTIHCPKDIFDLNCRGRMGNY